MKPVQKRIVIASILKPIDDTRMYEKMAVTLADSGKYELFVIGFPAKDKMEHPNITFLPSKRFGRISFARLLSPFEVFLKVLKVKPEVLIVNSHELLIVGVANRILFGAALIYDIQENYYRNLRHTKAFPGGIKQVLALWVRLKEKLSAPFIKWFYLAEKGYATEMDFFAKRYTILENKAALPDRYQKAPKSKDEIRLLFSGTLAETTGVFQAINLAHRLYQINAKVSLKIIGYCAQPNVLHRIKEALGNAPYIDLHNGGDRLVPHHEIIDAISAADFGIICYPPALHTKNSIPTKLYEYLAGRLPILLQPHPVWVGICAPFQAAIVVDFDAPDVTEIITKMESQTFYSTAPVGVTWKEEGDRLLQSLEALF